jgi:predicted CXXCH cytochrome family protein
MKGLKVSLVVLTATLIVGISGMAYAFHSGGVAECEGCHSMHSPAPGGSFLLTGATQSETCLNCHQGETDTGPSSYHISSSAANMGSGPPLQRTPGGDFGWLRKTYTWGTGTADTEDGATHGHNIIAPAKGYNVDPHNATAPGGTFPAGQLACNSCHDPHGQYRRNASNAISKSGGAIWASGSYPGTGGEPRTVGTENLSVGVYRLLAGAGYTKATASFTGNPAAKVPSTYNRTEQTTQTRVAYGNATTGGHVSWGTWCSTCHPNMHSSGNMVHPTDESLGSTIATNYGQYVKSGDMTGSAATSFLSVVPFINNSADYAGTLSTLAVNNNTQLGGPASNDQVSCLSCHRTHASAWPHMLRYSYGYEFVTKNGEYVATDNPDFANWGSRRFIQAAGRTIADMEAGHYGRKATMWSAYQRVLCNKCHAKD